MFGVGGGEIVVLALIALVLFGNEDLPKNMRKLFKAWNNFRGVTNDLQRSWLDVRDQVTRDLLTDQSSLSNPQQLGEKSESSKELKSEIQKVSEGDKPEDLHNGEQETPSIQQAQGRVAQGDFNLEQESTEVSSAPRIDKST